MRLRSSSSTPSTTPVPVLPTTPSPPRRVVSASSTVSLTSTARPSPLTVSLVCTVVSDLPLLGIIVYRGLYFGMYDSIKPVVLVGPLANNFLASFALGWCVTTGAGIASYPLDTVRRRMMMTSGEAVKYKSSFDAFQQIVAKEGVKSLFKGAGANILRGVAGAGVLSIYDQLQVLLFGKAFKGGSG